ncbi:uncharacterized protein LOC111086656 isoform X2 [Limulus polyphemus]|nr:uncharacterized protein LOC111086656 isoform X2 [Limulus polyphemus]
MDSRRSNAHLRSHLRHSKSAPLFDETTHFETTIANTNSWSPSSIQEDITDKEAQLPSKTETDKFFSRSKSVLVESVNASAEPCSSSNFMFSSKEKETIYTVDGISSQTEHGKNQHTELLTVPSTSQTELISTPSTSQTEPLATPTTQMELLEVHMMVKDTFATGKAVDYTSSLKPDEHVLKDKVDKKFSISSTGASSVQWRGDVEVFEETEVFEDEGVGEQLQTYSKQEASQLEQNQRQFYEKNKQLFVEEDRKQLEENKALERHRKIGHISIEGLSLGKGRLEKKEYLRFRKDGSEDFRNDENSTQQTDQCFSPKMYSEDSQKISLISRKPMATGGDIDSIYFETNQRKLSSLTIQRKISGQVTEDDQPITDSRVPQLKIPQTYFDEHVRKPFVPVDSVRQHNRFLSQDLSEKPEEPAPLSEIQNSSAAGSITPSTSDKEPKLLNNSELSTPSNELKSFNDVNVSGCTDQTLLSVPTINRRNSSESMKATNECNSNQLPDNSPLLAQLSSVKKKKSSTEILSIQQESLSPKTSEKNLKQLPSTLSVLMPSSLTYSPASQSALPSFLQVPTVPTSVLEHSTVSVSNNQSETHSSSYVLQALSKDVPNSAPKNQLDKWLQTRKLNSTLQKMPTSVSVTSSLARNLKSPSLLPLEQLILYFNNPVSKPLSSIVSPAKAPSPKLNHDSSPNSDTTRSQPKEIFYIDISRNRVYNPKSHHSTWSPSAKITSINSEKIFEKSWSHRRPEEMPLVKEKVNLKELFSEEETEGREIKMLVVRKKGPINISLKKGDEPHVKDRILVSEIWPGDGIPLKGELQEGDEILMIENTRLKNKSLTIANAALRDAVSNSDEYFQIIFTKRA